MSDRGTKAARAMISALFLAAYGFAGLFCMWRFPALDPTIPAFKVVSSQIPGAEEGFERPGSFEVKRDFVSDRHAYARVCAYLHRRPKAEELVREGRSVVADTGHYEIGCADTELTPGQSSHDRFWQLPLLPADDYAYVSKMVFSNPIHSHEVWLPEIAIKLR